MGCGLSAPDDDADSFESVTHEFTIRRYSRSKGIGPGKSIPSRDFFAADGRKWQVRFYPDGYGPGPSPYAAFFVETLHPPRLRAVRARFTIQLLKPDGGVAYTRRADRPVRFDRRCSSWGFPEFVRRDELEGAPLAVLDGDDDSIRARCIVDVVPKKKRKSAVTVPPPDFAANAMDFLRSGRAPFDVKFSVDGGAVFEAHRLVVAARSDWFAAAVYGHGDGSKGAETTWVEATTPCVAVHGTSPDAFGALLHYMYHDTLPEEMMKEKGDAVMTRELFEAADMFLVERLKKMCANRMCRFINDDTVEGIMDLAKAHSCKELERACRNHLKRRKALAVRR
jgi:speckle-type POZ protein